jgi:hypothetical protein
LGERHPGFFTQETKIDTASAFPVRPGFDQESLQVAQQRNRISRQSSAAEPEAESTGMRRCRQRLKRKLLMQRPHDIFLPQAFILSHEKAWHERQS